MLNWIVQTNLVKEELYPSIEDATKRHGHGCVGLKIIPFSDSIEFLADIGFEPPAGKLIPYGSTSMIKMFDRSKWNRQGFFFNQDNLRTSKWVEKLGTRMLNWDARFGTLKSFIGAPLSDQRFFVKPDNDLKDFTGSELCMAEIATFYDQVSAGGFCFTTDIPIVVSSLKNTGWEYRIFMIKQKPIAMSSYKLKDMCRTDKRVPFEVLRFAMDTAAIWCPDEAYVMDVCETDEGYKVVEFNCLNASGFYSCNVDTIVQEVSEYVSSL